MGLGVGRRGRIGARSARPRPGTARAVSSRLTAVDRRVVDDQQLAGEAAAGEAAEDELVQLDAGQIGGPVDRDGRAEHGGDLEPDALERMLLEPGPVLGGELVQRLVIVAIGEPDGESDGDLADRTMIRESPVPGSGPAGWSARY